MKITNYINNCLYKIYDIISGVLSFEICNTNEGPIHLKNIIIAIFFMIFTTRVYFYIKKYLKKIFIDYLFFDHDSSSVIIKTLSSFILMVYILIILHIAGVPLYLFNFLGGAIALSIGLGIKDLVLDFISGIIITMNKLIVQKDIIKMNDNYFLVKNIGLFNITVSSISGLEITFPNHIFQKNIVVNCNTHRKPLRFELILHVKNNKDDSDHIVQVLEDLFLKIINNTNADYFIPSLLKNNNNNLKYHIRYNITIESLNDIEHGYQIAIETISNYLNNLELSFEIEIMKPINTLPNLKT